MKEVIVKRIGGVLLALAMALVLAPALTQTVHAAGTEPPLEDGVYEISTAEEMVWLSEEVNAGRGAEYDVLLVDDIDLGETPWIPIGYSNATGKAYKGTFDGNECTITIHKIDDSVIPEGQTWARVGLFGILDTGSVVKDLTVSGEVKTTSTAGSLMAGSVAGELKMGATIVNCINDAEVSGNSTGTYACVGGIVGQAAGNSSTPSRIINCYNACDFTDNNAGKVSGIVGQGSGYGIRSNCVNGARIEAANAYYDGTPGAVDGYASNWDTVKPVECYNADIEKTYKDNALVPNCDLETMDFAEKVSDWNASVSEWTEVDDFWDVSPEGYPIPTKLNGYETIRNLTNVEIADKGANAPYEGDFVSKYKAAKTYVLPKTVEVTVDDEELAADAYTWDPETGTLTIPEDEVLGKVEITITATTHSATHGLTVNADENLTYTGSEANAVTEDGKNVYEGTDFAFDLKAADHYQVGEITVTVGGTKVTPQIKKNDLETEAAVTIASADITGDLVIDVKAKASAKYTVAAGTLTRVDYAEDNPAEAYAGWPVKVKAAAQEGYYLLKKNISITAGGEAVDADLFSFKDGVISIDAAAVTGDLVINAEAIPPVLQEVELVDELEDGEEYVIAGTSLTDQDGDAGYVLTSEANTSSNMKVREAVLAGKDGKLHIADPQFDQELTNAIWKAAEGEKGFVLANGDAQLTGSWSTLKTAETGSAWVTTAASEGDTACVKMNVASQNYSLSISKDNAKLEYGEKHVRLYKLIDSSLADRTVTFDSRGGSEVAAATVKDGKKVKKPADPVREGYSLEGWYKDEKCTEGWNFKADTVTEDITLYAKWTPVYQAFVQNVTAIEPGKSYIITGNAGDIAMTSEEAPSTSSYYHYMAGQKIALSADADSIVFPSEKAYAECLWKAEEGTAEGAFKLYNDAISGNLYGSSTYLSNTKVSDAYKDEFVVGNYGLSVSGSGNYGAQYDTANGYFKLAFYASAANRVKFYEIVESCKVTFDMNDDADEPLLKTVKKGEKVEKPADPVRSGYLFEGWIDEDGEYFDFETPINEDTTLTAEWYSLSALSAELDEYVDEDNLSQYREEQQAEVKDAVAAGKAAIEGAKSVEEAEAALDDAVAAIEEIPTDEELTEKEAVQLEGAKAAANDVIDQLAAKAKESVGDSQEALAEIDALAAAAKESVASAETIDNLAEITAAAATGINDTVTAFAEEQAQGEAADLAAAKDAATQAVLKTIEENGLDPAVTMQTAIDAIMAINAADSIEAVNAAKAAADESLGALIADKAAYDEAVKKAEAATVTGFKAKAKKGRKAQLTWKAAKGVSGYEIYRATKKTGKYKKVKTISKASAKKLINKKLKAKKKYFYKIRPYTLVKNVKGETEKVYGKYSAVKKIKARK